MWTKIDGIDGVANCYRCPPQYKMFTHRMEQDSEDAEDACDDENVQNRPEAWSAEFMADHAVGSIEVWTYGSEQDVMILCEKLARAAGWMA